MEFDYQPLIGFIYSTPELRSKAGFARYLGISFTSVQAKLSNKQSFTQEQIAKIKVDFNLTAEQIDRYFFTAKLLKENIHEEGKQEGINS